MQYVWSLWTKPLNGIRGSGWKSEKDHLLSWILSVETARRHGKTTCLITDDLGAKVLIEDLNLPFDRVSTDLNKLAYSDPDWWAIGKVYSYSIQKKPFMHIDSDVFLWSPLPAELISAPVFAQCPETHHCGTSSYRCAEFEFAIASVNGWIPEELDYYVPDCGFYKAVSCGILGANRVDFIQHFALSSLKMMTHPRNKDAWKLLTDKNGVSLIFEQQFLAACLEFHNSNSVSPFHDIKISYLFPSLYEAVHSAKDVGYTHLLGDTKKNPHIVKRLEKKVRVEYPDLYELCLKLLSRENNAPWKPNQ